MNNKIANIDKHHGELSNVVDFFKYRKKQIEPISKINDLENSEYRILYEEIENLYLIAQRAKEDIECNNIDPYPYFDWMTVLYMNLISIKNSLDEYMLENFKDGA